MSTTAARKTNFDSSVEDWSVSNTRVAVPSGMGGEAADASVVTSTLRVPDFRAYGEAHAEMSRQAGRLNAASISDQEHDQLLQERQVLLDKLFGGTLTRREALRLEYVRWSLDRIEDARYGITLDMLESNVSLHERFASDIAQLHEDLRQHTGRKK
ncbi:MAG: hypothetical protein WB524_14610 [Acidobacteriaceae bacterium]